ncbi:flagellar biosynthetic protein FliO [Oceanibaculum pacificum]|uniref:flagellar biosynthetic protein FliO n=1 Tax=Oceanibaculum pacificum TaxID=580166 RepID=UPI000A009B24|nr:flagellar biosynthetic protein FliO [Oceanibaculum pacificum]
MSVENYLYAILALVFVLALLGLLFLVLRRFGFGGAMPRNRGQRRRLALVEVLPVDAKRRLVLLRRDGQEHLILLGPDKDLLVESVAPGSAVAAASDEAPVRTPVASPVASPAASPAPAGTAKREPAFGAMVRNEGARDDDGPTLGTPRDRRS